MFLRSLCNFGWVWHVAVIPVMDHFRCSNNPGNLDLAAEDYYSTVVCQFRLETYHAMPPLSTSCFPNQS